MIVEEPGEPRGYGRAAIQHEPRSSGMPQLSPEAALRFGQ
jgi:hypothetical protein